MNNRVLPLFPSLVRAAIMSCDITGAVDTNTAGAVVLYAVGAHLMVSTSYRHIWFAGRLVCALHCFSISSSLLSAQHLVQGLQSPVVAL